MICLQGQRNEGVTPLRGKFPRRLTKSLEKLLAYLKKNHEICIQVHLDERKATLLDRYRKVTKYQQDKLLFQHNGGFY